LPPGDEDVPCAWGIGESSEFGLDESFGAGGPETVVNKLRALQNCDDPVPGLLKLCRSYELLELEGAQGDLFGEGIRLLACGLSHDAASARKAYSDALSLTCQAMQNNEDALLNVLSHVLILDKVHLPEVSGEPSQLSNRDPMADASRYAAVHECVRYPA
jgi:hypothetical protein